MSSRERTIPAAKYPPLPQRGHEALLSPGSERAVMLPVFAAYLAFGIVIAIGFVTIARRGDWRNAFGRICYAAPIAAFGTEHFTLSSGIASLIPKWIPWHLFWTYFIGACFIGAALSMVTGIGMRLSASLLALTFFLFVVLMDLPAWGRRPENLFAAVLALRELAFSGGALAAAGFGRIGRAFVSAAVLFYGVVQFMHPDHVPGVPLQPLLPAYVHAGMFWAYFAAVVYAIGGTLLLINRKTRTAAAAIGATLLMLILFVYVPIAVHKSTTIEGFNFLADTLMFAGAVLLLPETATPP